MTDPQAVERPTWIVWGRGLVLWAGATLLVGELWERSFDRSVGRTVRELEAQADDVRAGGSERIERLGAHAIPALIESFGLSGRHGGGGDARRTAAVNRLLCRTPAEVAVPALIEALDHPDAYVRHGAGIALSAFEEEAVPHLARALAESPAKRVRTAAAWVFSLIGPASRGAQAELEAALQDSSREVRYVARYALESVKPEHDAVWEPVLRDRRARLGR